VEIWQIARIGLVELSPLDDSGQDWRLVLSSGLCQELPLGLPLEDLLD